jgi:hypothetical protein
MPDGKTTVRFTGQSPVRLVLYDEIKNEAGGKQFRQRVGAPTIEIGAGDTEVDSKFFDEWLAQNAESDLVKKGYVMQWPPKQKPK